MFSRVERHTEAVTVCCGRVAVRCMCDLVRCPEARMWLSAIVVDEMRIRVYRTCAWSTLPLFETPCSCFLGTGVGDPGFLTVLRKSLLEQFYSEMMFGRIG